jgi:hypothetical protein
MAIVSEVNWVEAIFRNTMLSGFYNPLEKTIQGQHAEFVPTCDASVGASFTPCYPRPTSLGMCGSWRRFLWW